MLRKLNFTERASVPASAVRITLRRESDGMLVFDPHFALGDIALPMDARLYVEATYRTSYMRFDCGSVGVPTPPADRRLTEIDSVHVRFRVKIVDRDHRVLAMKETIIAAMPEADAGRRMPLLPVDFRDLGDQIWRLQFEPDTAVLELNNRIAGIENSARSDTRFFALVYPAAVREVLIQILLIDRYRPDEESDEWWSLWLRWGARFTTAPAPPDEEDQRRWIDDVVAGFCAHFAVVKRANDAAAGER